MTKLPKNSLEIEKRRKKEIRNIKKKKDKKKKKKKKKEIKLVHEFLYEMQQQGQYLKEKKN